MWILAYFLGFYAIHTVTAFPGDPVYPTPKSGFNKSTQIFVVNGDCLQPDGMVFAQTVQGATARNAPTLWLNLSGTAAELLQNEIALAHGVSFVPLPDCNLTSLLESVLSISVAPKVTQYVRVTNVTGEEVTAAFAAAATMENGGIVAPVGEAEDAAIANGLSMAWDATGKTWAEAVAKFNTSGTSWSRSSSCIQAPFKSNALAGWCIYSRALTWWSTSSLPWVDPVTQQALHQLSPPAAIYGWGTSEFNLVDVASAYGAWVHASDWAHNLATSAGYALPDIADMAPPQQPAPGCENVHTVAFIESDGDNIQFVTNNFLTGVDWWGGPRGVINFTWTMSPALFRVLPSALHYMYRTATPQDSFIAGPSGVGYAYPDQFHPSFGSTFASQTGQLLAATGVRSVNVIGSEYTTSSAASLLSDDSIRSLVWYDYSSYSALNGNLTFVNNKPVIGGRFQLWNGTFDNVTSILPKLLALPADPTSANGYSVIPVHAWTNSIADAVEVTRRLNIAAPGKFQVLGVEQLLDRVSRCVPH